MKKILIILMFMLAVVSTTHLGGVTAHADFRNKSYNTGYLIDLDIQFLDGDINSEGQITQPNPNYWNRYNYESMSGPKVMSIVMPIARFNDLRDENPNNDFAYDPSLMFIMAITDMDGGELTFNEGGIRYISNHKTVGSYKVWTIVHDVLNYGERTEMGYHYSIHYLGETIMDGYFLKRPEAFKQTSNELFYEGVQLSSTHSQMQLGDTIYNNYTNNSRTDPHNYYSFIKGPNDVMFLHYRLSPLHYFTDNLWSYTSISVFNETNDKMFTTNLTNILSANCTLTLRGGVELNLNAVDGQNPNGCISAMMGFIPLTMDGNHATIIPYGYNSLSAQDRMNVTNMGSGIITSSMHYIEVDGDRFNDVYPARSEPSVFSHFKEPFSINTNRNNFYMGSAISFVANGLDDTLSDFFNTFELESSEFIGIKTVKDSTTTYMRSVAHNTTVNSEPLNDTFDYMFNNRGYSYTISNENTTTFENDLTTDILYLKLDGGFNFDGEYDTPPLDARVDNFLTRYRFNDENSITFIVILIIISLMIIATLLKAPLIVYTMLLIVSMIVFLSIGWMPIWLMFICILLTVGMIFAVGVRGRYEL